MLGMGSRKLNFTAELPVSKSIANRLLIVQAVGGRPAAENESRKLPDDVRILYECLLHKDPLINSGDAGTATRFLTAYFSAQPGREVQLIATERMMQRPMAILIESLRSLGADIVCTGKEGHLPLMIRGRELDGGKLCIDAAVSSQFISALLMIAPRMKNGLHLELTGKVSSEPYIRLTLELMKMNGIEYTYHDRIISIAPQKYRVSIINPEMDWSAASYWYELGAFSESCEITLPGLSQNSLQGDSIISEIMKSFGLSTEFKGGAVIIRKENKAVKEFAWDFSDCPDLAQTVAVTCAGLGIPARLNGLHTLKVKETDRIKALKAELEKTGAMVLTWEDRIEIIPGTLKPAVIKTYSDHRMAMAFAPLCMLIEGMQIETPGVVSKSYPGFWNELKKAGIKIKTEQE
jgi:3-phosphoshikimate 1-carboxyvinyltransferase